MRTKNTATKKKIFFDMDGTLCIFQVASSMDELNREGYFRNIPPHTYVVEAMNLLISEYKDICSIYSLSSYFETNEHAVTDKNIWLDNNVPQLQKTNRLFVPYHMRKSEYVSKECRVDLDENCILVDDFNKNLFEWKNDGGTAVKLINGINNVRGTWSGLSTFYTARPEAIVDLLLRSQKRRRK